MTLLQRDVNLLFHQNTQILQVQPIALSSLSLDYNELP